MRAELSIREGKHFDSLCDSGFQRVLKCCDGTNEIVDLSRLFGIISLFFTTVLTSRK